MGPFGINPEEFFNMMAKKNSQKPAASLSDGEILAVRKVIDLRKQIIALTEDETLERMTLIRNIHRRLDIPRDLEFTVSDEFKIEMDPENYEKWEAHLRALGQTVPTV